MQAPSAPRLLARPLRTRQARLQRQREAFHRLHPRNQTLGKRRLWLLFRSSLLLLPFILCPLLFIFVVQRCLHLLATSFRLQMFLLILSVAMNLFLIYCLISLLPRSQGVQPTSPNAPPHSEHLPRSSQRATSSASTPERARSVTPTQNQEWFMQPLGPGWSRS